MYISSELVKIVGPDRPCQPFNNYKERRYSHEKLNKTVIVQSNLIIGNSMSNLEAVHNRQGPTDTLQGSQNVPTTSDFAVYLFCIPCLFLRSVKGYSSFWNVTTVHPS
jgi:hypothetical protein